ncbi:hypothetical protein EYC84_010993 [Monilinia fructicola]|uniref:Uncharacterized protein n=1 Tax=Monilinia fructicola TaxID=38448 RepID=A0A5M9J6U0_MONFR|nr:hypothetical protein EYC84_010993 [Monilinia fructicola]
MATAINPISTHYPPASPPSGSITFIIYRKSARDQAPQAHDIEPLCYLQSLPTRFHFLNSISLTSRFYIPYGILKKRKGHSPTYDSDQESTVVVTHPQIDIPVSVDGMCKVMRNLRTIVNFFFPVHAMQQKFQS